MVSQPIVFREQEMRQNLGIMQGHKVPFGGRCEHYYRDGDLRVKKSKNALHTLGMHQCNLVKALKGFL